MREALIKDPSSADPEAIGTAGLQSLSQQWTSTGVQGIVGGNDVLAVIELQSQTPAFWAVDESFRAKFPAHADLTLSF